MKFDFNLLIHLMPTIILIAIAGYAIASCVLTIINYWDEIINHIYTSNDILLIIVSILSIVGFILIGRVLWWGCNNENFK